MVPVELNREVCALDPFLVLGGPLLSSIRFNNLSFSSLQYKIDVDSMLTMVVIMALCTNTLH